MEHIQRETLRYALEIKNDSLFSLDASELRVFIGILIFSGYVKLPSERMYWSEAVDVHANRLVREAMTRGTYMKIKRYLHVQNNNGRRPGDTDRGFKVRPLISMLNDSFRKFGIYQQNLAVDEMIVRYYGHHGLKQFMRGKPVRFGYKLWALCGADGFCHKFDLYCGKEVRPELQGKPLGSRVVLDMIGAVENPQSHSLFFDNFFTSRSLLSELRARGMQATGTVRENRMEKCPLKTQKELAKEGCGAYDARFDKETEVLAVRWFDNKSVNMLSNYDFVHPIRMTQRFNRSTGGKVDVPQPRLLSTYNDGMGGVDIHDWHLSKYNIAIRGKKWYWCLLTRMIDMTVVNAWLLHKVCTPNGKAQLSQVEFRREIAISYLRSSSRNSACLPTSPALVPQSMRYDGIGHLMGPMGKRLRCRLETCSQKPSKWCTKCRVHLCVKCFVPYHTA
ncbi:PiggyBac transposable element-derived protein 2 [Amphibalanus amphitrite]|uniref:PiggyBac transposable element-derived protein 2 n=1 Tax=Amphibalanus amphitrite TaxID=1232801 RepID=A0A6A4X134_AMPAM|nr:PiggyBac transposable element-derived protein 2 [Amphibalanus amphitrite]